MRYTWVITRCTKEPSIVGVAGPQCATKEEVDKCKKEGIPFRMADCDGETPVYGKIMGDYEGFEPLDDFGMPSLGCTDMEYKEDGKWLAI